jgi:hypothetical protein
MVARLEGVAANGVFIDTCQPGGLADATTVLQVLEDVECLVVGQPGAEQGGAFAFGEADLAGAAGKHAPVLAGAVAEAEADVALTPQAIIRTVRVLTTEEVKVFHEHHRSGFSGLVNNASLGL